VDECHVHIGPLLMGDPDAAPAAAVGPLPRLADASRWTLIDTQSSGGDCRLVYRRDAAG
jgi:riboflavin biosynthesis pyrimidine reductase